MKCEKCGNVLKGVANKMSHRRHHFEARPFKCCKDRCLKAFPTMVQLQAHRRTHIDRRIYTCRYCHRWFLSRSHRECHRCRFGQPPKHKCPECPEEFHQLLSLSHHIRKSHQAARIKPKTQDQPDVRAGNNVGKVLLKISAGKSLTILSDHKSSKQAKVRIKRKQKRSLKPNKSGSIILSIKKGMVSIPKELPPSKHEKTKVTTDFETIPTPSYKIQSQSGELKLKIKANVTESSVKDVDYVNMNTLALGHTTTKTDSEDYSDSPSKVRNGIIIVKDKQGKLCAEQLAQSPYKRKDRENMFDSLKDAGIWKVLPSPRPDGGSEVLKLKLSPQKPICIIDSSLDDIQCTKYLGIPTKPNTEQPSDMALLDLLPSYPKELDSVSNVNDSGIEAEVLSSSSCNRSNGNSVRSVALEDNSPTYFNTDGDSLLSLDSPYMENFNKAEHNICPKCGGIVLETNNNTRSPGKCKCSFSNPNSPFQTPLSPVKVSDINKVQDITAAPVMLETPNCAGSFNCDFKGNESSEAIEKTPSKSAEHLTASETNDDYDSDIMIIDIDGKNRSLSSGNGPVNEFKGRLRLKLRSEKCSKSKNNDAVSETETKSSQLLDSGSMSNPKGVELKNQKSGRRKIEVGSQNSPIVLDDVDVDCQDLRTSQMENVEPVNKLSLKRPLFKRKSQTVETEDTIVEKEEPLVKHVDQVTKNDEVNSTDDSNGKKRLFKKRLSVETSKEQPVNKKPLFKKQMSVDALKEKPTETVVNYDDLVGGAESEKTVHTKCNDKPDNKEGNCKLKTVDVEHNDDDDSLQQWDENIINSMSEKESKKAKRTVKVKDNVNSDVSKKSLNPFQQQFLSFLSSNITEMKKERLTSHTQDKCNLLEDRKEQSHAANEDIETKKDCGSKNKHNEVKDNVDKKNVCGKLNAESKMNNQQEMKSERTSDSFSWLNIFTGNKQDDAACPGTAGDETHDVMASLSQDLAAINQKMDISNDEDDNLLDMDDVFKSDKLSTLQPKEFVVEPQVPCGDNVSSHLRKRQTAKRTIGKFKGGRRIKRKVELDFTYPESSSDEEMLISHHAKSDPDFCLQDSDDEFETQSPRKKRTLSRHTCSRSKKQRYVLSDTDSESTGDEKSDCDSATSKNHRTKQNTISCCSCCKNGCDHISGNHKKSYKLPRNYRQFIKCTVRLLDVQKKLHCLFLALFPDCAEMISGCKIGTAEFDSLMDEVLGGMDDFDESVDPDCSRFSSDSRPKYLQTESCQINNIGMSFTSPDSATRTSEIDYVPSDEKSCRTPVSSESSPMYRCNERSFVPYNSFMTAPPSASLKFENNTLASDDESVGTPSPRKDCQPETVTRSCSVTSNSGLVSTSQLLLQVASSAGEHSQETSTDKASQNIQGEQINNFSVTKRDQSTELCEARCEEDLSSIPVVNITIDLNAAHVALCSNPRHCLQTLHNKTIKLIKVLLPSVDFKSNFFKNLDNLEFLIDLLIDANEGREVKLDEELKCESLIQSFSQQFASNIEDSVLIPADDSVVVIPIVSSDLFEQQIKSQRESLKRDLDVIEEEGEHNDKSWKSSEDIWHSIVSLNNMARSSQSQRKRTRDSRLRKRSADEKRTLFVQEKLNNNQNSTFVCHTHDNVNKSVEQSKKTLRQRGQRNSKERFFSELDLGNPSSSAITSPIRTFADEKGTFENSFTAFLNRDNFNCGNTDSRQREDELTTKSTVAKNIFELMQPV